VRDYSQRIHNVIYEGCGGDCLDASRIRTDRIGDNPKWAIGNFVPELCYCKSADVTCHTEAEHGFVAHSEAIPQAAAGAKGCRCDVARAVGVRDPSEQLLSLSSATSQPNQVVSVFQIANPEQRTYGEHEAYLAHSCISNMPAFCKDIDWPGVGDQPVERVGVFWDRSLQSRYSEGVDGIARRIPESRH
jgi:hypothetical protein